MAKRWKQRGKIVALLLLVAALALLGLWWLYYRDVRGRAFQLVRARNIEKSFDASVPDDVSEHLRVAGTDGATLDVWLIAPRRSPNRDSVHWVVILHGLADHKRTMLGLGRRFANHGVGAVLLDLRGHGLSSQTPLTFGAKEVPDISMVLDAVEDRGYALGEVGTYGPSYGGAIAMLLAARDPRVTRAVSAGGFSSFRRLVTPTLVSRNAFLASLVPAAFVDHMVTLAARHGHFDAEEASTEAYIDDTDAQFVLVHSRDDEIVPYDQAEALVERCGRRCELISLEDTSHHGSLSNKPLRYRMHEFLTRGPLESL